MFPGPPTHSDSQILDQVVIRCKAGKNKLPYFHCYFWKKKVINGIYKRCISSADSRLGNFTKTKKGGELNFRRQVEM
jgi:hypothetical protein